MSHDGLEAAEDHPLAVERHRVGFRVHARILEVGGHHLGHAGVARGLVGPFDPAEDDRLVVLRLDRAVEVGGVALGHIVAPAFHDARGTEVDEHVVAGAGVGDEFVFVSSGHREDEAVEIGHVCSPS